MGHNLRRIIMISVNEILGMYKNYLVACEAEYYLKSERISNNIERLIERQELEKERLIKKYTTDTETHVTIYSDEIKNIDGGYIYKAFSNYGTDFNGKRHSEYSIGFEGYENAICVCSSSRGNAEYKYFVKADFINPKWIEEFQAKAEEEGKEKREKRGKDAMLKKVHEIFQLYASEHYSDDLAFECLLPHLDFFEIDPNSIEEIVENCPRQLNAYNISKKYKIEYKHARYYDTSYLSKYHVPIELFLEAEKQFDGPWREEIVAEKREECIDVLSEEKVKEIVNKYEKTMEG